ncbi:penicillin-binding protein 2 [Nocardiopsis ansamitocini]|uniref:Penicillin-binding protein 2 n=1 Tax=Nocardiopsis ansamitocini TaxID=1670832 RepID=A0A9W6P5U0_9ACTN|nr:penicillin-binding protein 2 [Nocardiopsis ansamitocini]GLU47965.1 penicillin-binding protein 2 [Nocardiopsis ansamitocini]
MNLPPVTGPGRGHRPGRIGLFIAQALSLALLLVLAGRLWYLQVPRGEHYQSLAAANRTQDLVIPATRGQILDSNGRPLVRNHTELIVSADFHALAEEKDGGDAVLARLADVLDTPFEELRQRMRLCGPEVSRPCWPGSPYQPITLAEGIEPRMALQIMERKEEFPGISAQQHAVREYPQKESAAQVLGYLQPVTQEELEARETLRTQFSGVDQVGRDGLEFVYDDQLRGTAGVRKLAVDSRGNVTGVVEEVVPKPGMHLVTGIDATVQQAVEQALSKGIERSKGAGYPADAAAGVVLDVRTGRLIAMASVPTYDPSVWDGGIDQSTYEKLLSEKAGQPLISRALQGQFPPASAFKVSSLSAAVENGAKLTDNYDCPGSMNVGNREFRNYESGAYGSLSLHRAIVVSCNTVFYKFAYDQWLADGGTNPVGDPKDPMVDMARGFGFGRATGIDLPNEVTGRIPDRQWKKDYWKATRNDSCKRAKSGYPEQDDPQHAAYLKAVATENCTEGYTWRAGDAANFAIGQGDVLATPLQMAVAYAAIANGGTLYEPRVAKALISADGKQVQEVPPVEAGELPVSDTTLAYLRNALADVPKEGTAAGAFGGFPQDKVAIAGKTGSATVVGQRESAWFASYAPADDPRFAVVVFISQGGTGGSAAAPVAREIYEAIYGFGPEPVDPAKTEVDIKSDEQDERDGAEQKQPKPALPGGEPPSGLPTVRPDGTVQAP